VWCGVRVMRRVLFDSEECRAFAASCADQANCARAEEPSVNPD
jgi:hypothetical protein